MLSLNKEVLLKGPLFYSGAMELALWIRDKMILSENKGRILEMHISSLYHVIRLAASNAHANEAFRRELQETYL